MSDFTESVVEEAALAWFGQLGWTMQEKATQTVLKQAEVLSGTWVTR